MAFLRAMHSSLPLLSVLGFGAALVTASGCSGSADTVSPGQTVAPSGSTDAGGVAPEPGASDGGVTRPGDPLPADPTAACPAAFKATKPAEGLNKGFTVAGQEREFVLILPPATFTGPRPLFVGFNGTSENGTRFATRAKLAELAAKGFVVVVPSSVGNGQFWPIWDAMRAPGTEAAPNKDLDLFDALVGCTAAHFAIDKTRIFVGGHSAGGIFTNKVLRARSNLVAGGIVGSGVFDLTGNGSAAPLGDLFVLVTWGGDNDTYRGTTPSGVTVPAFSFVEQASLASRYYEAQPAVEQAYCRGNELGHAWLPINGWFADAMIAHPKGAIVRTPLAALPAGAPITCSGTAYVSPALPQLTCSQGSLSSCQAACQLMADCVGENRTVGTVMQNELAAFGFTTGSCGSCVTRCQQASTGAANTAVLSCFQQRQATAQCTGGIEGAFPFMQAVDACCKNRSDSTFCTGLCGEIVQNEAASAFFPACKQIAP